MNEEVDEFRQWDASYVLGALSAKDRKDFEIHMTNCDGCTRSVAELASIPGFLMKIDKETAKGLMDQPEPSNVFALPSAPIRDLARGVVAQRKRFRMQLVAGLSVAASTVIAVGLFLGSTAGQSGGQVGSNVTNSISATNVSMKALAADSMLVDMKVRSQNWGTQFIWSCTYRSEESSSTPESYDLVVTDAVGATTIVATWTEAGASAKNLVATTDIPVAKIKFVQIQNSQTHEALAQGII